jgi:hypothetical protein
VLGDEPLEAFLGEAAEQAVLDALGSEGIVALRAEERLPDEVAGLADVEPCGAPASRRQNVGSPADSAHLTGMGALSHESAV